MCGRYDLHDYSELTEGYTLPSDLLIKPNYNAAPTHTMPVVKNDRLIIMRWGLIPRWAKDEKIGYKLFNARSESVFEKPIWKTLITKHRCLVPANGFYEWEKREDGKHPFYIHPKHDNLLMFAGIWETWQHNDKDWLTYSILTTTPNKEMANLHDRMPVILERENYDQWLGADRREDIEPLLQPYQDNSLEIFEVGQEVNVAKANDERLILPINSR
jgi:putative SOS response-associated peptidase YedK